MKYQITDSLILKFFEHIIKESIEKKIEFLLSNFDNEVSGYSRIRVISPINTDLRRDFAMMQAGMSGEYRFYPKLDEYVSSRGTTGGEYEYFISMLNLFYSKVITFSFSKEIKEMIRSYLELLQIHLGNYDRYLDGTEQLILDIETGLESNTKLLPIEKNKLLLVKKTAEFFLNILLDYARRNNMEIVTFNSL